MKLKPQYLTYVSLALAISSSILAYGDTVAKVPGVPTWLAADWPFILVIAGIVHQVASVLVTGQVDANTAANTPVTPPPPPPHAS
jgi:hypothetical protein